jgi:hypothetical protein
MRTIVKFASLKTQKLKLPTFIQAAEWMSNQQL